MRGKEMYGWDESCEEEEEEESWWMIRGPQLPWLGGQADVDRNAKWRLVAIPLPWRWR